MPNQRKAGTRLVGAYVGEEQHQRLAAEARRRGITVADLVRELVDECIRRNGGAVEQRSSRGRR